MTRAEAHAPAVRRWGGRLLIVLGVAVLGVELWRYWTLAHPIQPWPVCIGAAIAFVGFYLEDPTGAKDGGGFLVQQTVAILGALPFVGRRATDRIAAAALEQQQTPAAAGAVLAVPMTLSGAGGDTVHLVPGLTAEPDLADDERGAHDERGEGAA